ncbi:hypothetical protein RUND412_001576 [Rhizina undulata]
MYRVSWQCPCADDSHIDIDGRLFTGTSFMSAGSSTEARTTTSSELDPRLKYDTSGPYPIILVPQPSDDPNDPLIMAATLGPILAANTITLSSYFERTFTDIALLTGWHLCGVGVAGFFFVPSARVWGKRHLYLLGTVLLVASSVWGGSAHSYKSLLGARVLQGIAITPFEALVNASVGDLYCVHQRGKRMALTNFALFGGAFFTPVIVGVMTERMSWRWPFYFVAIFSGIMLPLVFFFIPETAFRRPQHLNTDLASTEDFGVPRSLQNSDMSDRPETLSSGHRPVINDSDAKELGLNSESPEPVPQQRDSFLKRLALFNGRKTDDSILKLFLRPFALLPHPAVLWAMLTQGSLIGWTVMIGVVLGVVFMGPPLWFNEAKTGYLYTGAFVGATLGFCLAGPLADWSARYLTKLNGGIYEPEFRIVLVIPQFITGVIGLFGFGFTSADIAKYSWIGPEIFFALEVMGMTIGAVASALYIVDAHRDITIEIFTCLLIFKNFFSFGLTWSAFDWIMSGGIWRTFYVIGCVQIAIFLLSIPMYVFGKRNRSLMHRYDLLKITGLK